MTHVEGINWGCLGALVFCLLFWLAAAAVIVQKAKAVEYAPYAANMWPGQTPGDAKLNAEITTARAEWAKVGVGIREDFPRVGLNTCPKGIVSWMADSLDEGNTSANGRGWNCTVFINVKTLRNPKLVDLPYMDFGECLVVQHEVGHAYGLLHDDWQRYPIMGEGAYDPMSYCQQLKPRRNVKPFACNKKRLKVALIRTYFCGAARTRP